MSTNWKTPVGADLAKVVSRLLIAQANENTKDTLPIPLDTSPAGSSTDLQAPNRRDEEVRLVVEECRGAIRTGEQYPLSLTKGSVPPEAEVHVLNKAAYELLVSTTNLSYVIVTEKGAVAPFKVFWDAALAYFNSLRKGAAVTEPTDPTGDDYRNPISASNAPLAGTTSADVVGEVDMTTDGPYITPTSPLPLAPISVIAVAVGPGQGVLLAWTPDPNATSSSIYRGTAAGQEAITPIEITTGTNYVDDTTVPGTTYFYLVQSSNATGNSPFSEEVSVLAQ